MMNEPQAQKPQPKPSNDIDLQAMTTFPHISSDYMSDRVRNKFREFRVVKDAQGNEQVQITRDLWANMELFTQDFRLGNLSTRELFVVRYNIDLCSDILTALPEYFHKPALISLERAVAVTETSQSKSGFLRTLFNTFFQHSNVRDETPTKRSFFGMGKKNKGE